jgi:GTP cyclohydrolase IA
MSASDPAATYLAAFLTQVGVDGTDPETVGTPARVAELYANLFRGLHEPAPGVSPFPNPNEDRSPVLIRNLKFHSMCAHHLLPFFGVIDIAYVPSALVGGVGAFPRVVAHFAARPQVQERLVKDILDHLHAELAPSGLLVMGRARQLCMEMRGSRATGQLVCSAAMGSLAVGGVARAEVVAALAQ